MNDGATAMRRSSTPGGVLRLDSEHAREPARVGTKAARLAQLAGLGLPVPPGFVVDVDAARALDREGEDAAAVVAAIAAELAELGPVAVAVRSSALAEDLGDASFAGLYDTFLDLRGADEVTAAVRRCIASARSARVLAYRGENGRREGIAVLVQRMVPAIAAGVCFTADPVTGARDVALVSAVQGLGERLVSGETSAEEWRVGAVEAQRVIDRGVLDVGAVQAIVALARSIEAGAGVPQDIEWAIDAGEIALLQARPMTALPDAVEWSAPPGAWVRNFRMGEWIGDPVTPAFESWLLTDIEDRLGAYFEDCTGIRGTQPQHVVVNGWYFYGGFNFPSGWSMLLRLPVILFKLVTRFREIAAITPPLAHLGFDWATRHWRTNLVPPYRALVEQAERAVPLAPVAELPAWIDRLGAAAGVQFGSIVGVAGYAAKAELPLAMFWQEHLRGCERTWLEVVASGDAAEPGPHDVQGLDWVHPTLGELGLGAQRPDPAARARVVAAREAALSQARAALSDRPKLLARFESLVREAHRAHAVREEQARLLTLPWPMLRRAILRIGEHLADRGALSSPERIFWLDKREIQGAVDGPIDGLPALAESRRALWQRQRRLAAPLRLGPLPPMFEKLFASVERMVHGDEPAAPGEIRGLPGSPGRATGAVRVLRDASEIDRLLPGEVLVARVTTPAWTPAFARAAAIVTDTGSIASHASIVAREYGVPAVVATGDATCRLRDGMLVTVDGTRASVRIEAAGDGAPAS